MPVSCDPLPIKKLPATLPVALIVPAVTMLPPVMVPVALAVPTVAKLPLVMVPVTLRLDSVPTLVMLGCAAVVTVPAVVAAPDRSPTNVVLVILLSPVTVVTVAPKVSAVLPSVTAELDNRAWASVPVSMLVASSDVSARPLPVTAPEVFKLPPVMVPAAVIIPAVLMLPLVVLPVTARLLKVPTEVMLGCAAVVTVPAVVAAPVSAPTNVVDVTLDNPATVVVVEPKASVVEPRVSAELARRSCASVPLDILVALILETLAPDPLSVPTKLPAVALPVTVKDPALIALVIVALPSTVNKLATESNVNAGVAAALPCRLKRI